MVAGTRVARRGHCCAAARARRLRTRDRLSAPRHHRLPTTSRDWSRSTTRSPRDSTGCSPRASTGTVQPSWIAMRVPACAGWIRRDRCRRAWLAQGDTADRRVLERNRQRAGARRNRRGADAHRRAGRRAAREPRAAGRGGVAGISRGSRPPSRSSAGRRRSVGARSRGSPGASTLASGRWSTCTLQALFLSCGVARQSSRLAGVARDGVGCPGIGRGIHAADEILVARPDELWTPQYRAAIERRRTDTMELLAALDATLTAGPAHQGARRRLRRSPTSLRASRRQVIGSGSA